MYTITDVKDKIGSIRFCDGHGHYLKANLTGSTFPVVPIGTVLQDLSVKFPDGLQALSFFCRADQPRQLSHNQVDTTILQGALVLLCWEENGKIIVKDNTKWSPAELAKFNPFVVTDTSVLVVDTEHKIVYASSLQSFERTHTTWTSKAVSMDSILRYVTKKITLEELDKLATLEQRSRTKLAELLDSVKNLTMQVADYKRDFEYVQRDRSRIREDRDRSQKNLATIETELEKQDGQIMKLRQLLDDTHKLFSVVYGNVVDLISEFDLSLWPLVGTDKVTKKLRRALPNTSAT